MIVQCQQCQKKFKLDPDLIKGATAKVRCSQCQNIFAVQRPRASDLSDIETFPQETETPRPTKPSSRKGVLLFLVLLLLTVSGIGLWFYQPWISRSKSTPKRQDIELLHLVETRGYFVDNQRAGQIFVIEGLLRNDYPKPRRWIQLKAKLYTVDGSTARQLDFYVGNLLTTQQLQSMSLADMLSLIQRRPDSQERPQLIPAQEEVVFIVPFGDLPELSKLSDYSVEILGSQPG